eukprot:448988-Rhodomonas_salina.2
MASAQDTQAHTHAQDETHSEELENAAAVCTAMALANRTGLLSAMLKIGKPRSSHEWSTECRIHLQTAHHLLQNLNAFQIGVEMTWGVDGVRRFHIPPERAAAMKEMGPVCERLLIEAEGSMVKMCSLTVNAMGKIEQLRTPRVVV